MYKDDGEGREKATLIEIDLLEKEWRGRRLNFWESWWWEGCLPSFSKRDDNGAVAVAAAAVALFRREGNF